MIRSLLVLVALAVAGCPPSGAGPKPVGECTKEGESCTFSAGKLGTCVGKPAPCAPSAADSCFVCQSQH